MGERGEGERAIRLHAPRNASVGWSGGRLQLAAGAEVKCVKVNVVVVVDDLGMSIEVQFPVVGGREGGGVSGLCALMRRGCRALELQQKAGAAKNRQNARSWAMPPRNQTALGTQQRCSESCTWPVGDSIGCIASHGSPLAAPSAARTPVGLGARLILSQVRTARAPRTAGVQGRWRTPWCRHRDRWPLSEPAGS